MDATMYTPPIPKPPERVWRDKLVLLSVLFAFIVIAIFLWYRKETLTIEELMQRPSGGPPLSNEEVQSLEQIMRQSSENKPLSEEEIKNLKQLMS